MVEILPGTVGSWGDIAVFCPMWAVLSLSIITAGGSAIQPGDIKWRLSVKGPTMRKKRPQMIRLLLPHGEPRDLQPETEPLGPTDGWGHIWSGCEVSV